MFRKSRYLSVPKIVQIGTGCFKDTGILMQLSCVMLQVTTQVIELYWYVDDATSVIT